MDVSYGQECDGGDENFKSIAGLLEGSPTWVERNSVGGGDENIREVPNP